MWRLAYAVPLWLMYCAVTLPLWIVGAVIIPPMAFAKAWRPHRSRAYADHRIVQCWRVKAIDLVFGNAEDGVTGAQWYRDLHSDWSPAKQAIMWSAFRNPTNNVRFWPVVNPRIKPERIHYRGDFDAEQQARDTGEFSWSLTWQGVFCGLKAIVPVRGELMRVWAGWKLRPSDRNGVDLNDYRFPRCGFAVQIKRLA